MTTKSQHLQSVLSTAAVSSDIFALRPDYRALLLAVSGISPGPSDIHSESTLSEAEDSTRTLLRQHSNDVLTLPHIAAWRSAYQSFGAKPNKTRNSLEALTRRLKPDSGLPRINGLTDTYNAISLKHQIPIGGEDLDKYVGSARLVRADGTETFETYKDGKPVAEIALQGEVIWRDDVGVTCRHWNWRQGPRTALTEETRSALFILDVLDPVTDKELEKAAEALTKALQLMGPEVLVEKKVFRKQ